VEIFRETSNGQTIEEEYSPASLNLSAASSYFSDLDPNENNPVLEAPDSLLLASAKRRSAVLESPMAVGFSAENGEEGWNDV
jgi:hypothetical protein